MRINAKKFLLGFLYVTIGLVILRLKLAESEVKGLWDNGEKIKALCNIYGFCGEAISLSTVIMSLFNVWIWKWKWVQKLHKEPVLFSKYHGYLRSDYDGIDRECDVDVKQTFLSISIRMKTKESTSRSLEASIIERNNVPYLLYTYQNEPHADIQSRSPIHYGTVMVEINDTQHLEGNYFTGRGTKGSMKLDAIKQS